ncbi:MAG: hypothetical protein B0D92_02260 [Spirochaeta sp. LUC14_002_19_P3]|nr:MAG: hypothetical protein B0D92_02260 [Spirochaeta sp. LUC14_002_19_P3]
MQRSAELRIEAGIKNKSTPENLQIHYLADKPHLLPQLTDLFIAEWEPYYGNNGPGNAENDLRGSMNREQLPVCFIALGNETLLGTISLKEKSISHNPELTPWCAALLVVPEMRRRGIGSALVSALEREARRRDYRELYMSTDTANSIAEARGWKAIGSAESMRGIVTVYKLSLGMERF